MALPACVAVTVQVPAPTMVRVLPDTVQMLAAVLVEKVKLVRPLVELALSVMGEAPNVIGVRSPKVTI